MRDHYHRPTFARKSLSLMLSREDVFRKASGIKKVRKTVRGRTGLFHRMDMQLARWVRETRSLGIPVETYMLAIEGTRIMEELYPGQFTSEGKCKFTFSSGWS